MAYTVNLFCNHIAFYASAEARTFRQHIDIIFLDIFFIDISINKTAPLEQFIYTHFYNSDIVNRRAEAAQQRAEKRLCCYSVAAPVPYHLVYAIVFVVQNNWVVSKFIFTIAAAMLAADTGIPKALY